MNNSYWTKKDYIKHNKATRSLKGNDEKIIPMELDNPSGAPDIAAYVEPAPERSGVVTGLVPVDQNGVRSWRYGSNEGCR